MEVKKEKVNTKLFMYNGKQLKLDVDNIHVEKRIAEAYAKFSERILTLEESEYLESYAIKIVSLIKECINDTFDDDSAYEKLIGDETRLSKIMDHFYKISDQIGKMRSTILEETSSIFSGIANKIQAQKLANNEKQSV